MQKSDYLVSHALNLKKIMLIMKFFTLLLFVSLSTASAKSSYLQEVKFTLNLERVNLKDLFDKIEGSSEFVFVFNDKIIDLNKEITINVNNKTVEEVLEEVFKSSDNTFKVLDRQVVIAKKENSVADLEALAAQQQPQTKTITGVVVDDTKVPLPGVTVVVVGTTIGTITDANGMYTIKANSSNQLNYSFIGMQSQIVTVGNQTAINIKLSTSDQKVDEVVVVGYGTQKKASVVGSIVQADGKDLKRAGGVTNLSQALAGNLPGITTVQATGRPGEEDTKIYIRGRSTWNNTDPLVLVDGIERRLNDINPNEIETISVLKDASATAVYGVEGANGVILINSKRGKVGKPTLSVEANTTIKTVSKVYKQIDLVDALKYQNYAVEHEVSANPLSWVNYFPSELIKYYDKNLYPDSQYPQYAEMFPNVNWADQMLKDYTTSTMLNISLRGGTNFVKYFGSLSYSHEGDITNTKDLGYGYNPAFSFNRLNYRSNLDFDITTTTRLTVNLSGFLSQKNAAASGNDWQYWGGIYGFPSNIYMLQYPDGLYGQNTDARLQNPFVNLNRRGVSTNYVNQINTDYKIEQKLDFITKGLSAGVDVSLDFNINSSKGISDGAISGKYYTKQIVYAKPEDKELYVVYLNNNLQANNFYYVEPPISRSTETMQPGATRKNLFYQFKINYARQFGKHDVSALALVNRRESSTGSSFKTFREDWVGRLTYNYDTRYFVEVNGAYNGSDNFAPGYRFDLFPSLALGWTVSNEKFFKEAIPFMNHLKFRYSYGITGNDRIGAGRWPYAGSYSSSGRTDQAYLLGSPTAKLSSYGLWYESTIANPDLHWEVSTKKNYGMEFGFLKNLISGNFDYYTEHRSDIFMNSGQRNIPIYTGYMSNPAANIGVVDSWGWEAELKFSKSFANQLRLTSNLALTFAKNIVRYREDGLLTPSYQQAKGFALGQTRTNINSGIMQDWNQVYGGVLYETNAQTLPGDFRQIDFNADGKINTDDSAPYGYPSVPLNTYTWSLGSDYKGFSAMIKFYGVFNTSRSYILSEFMGQDNQTVLYNTQVENGWLPQEGLTSNALYHALRFSSKNAVSASTGDYYRYDGSYLRLQTVEVAYTFQEKEFLKRFGISSMRLYINGNNLAFWSNLPADDEGGNSSTEFDKYPTMKRYNLGINITF